MDAHDRSITTTSRDLSTTKIISNLPANNNAHRINNTNRIHSNSNNSKIIVSFNPIVKRPTMAIIHNHVKINLATHCFALDQQDDQLPLDATLHSDLQNILDTHAIQENDYDQHHDQNDDTHFQSPGVLLSCRILPGDLLKARLRKSIRLA